MKIIVDTNIVFSGILNTTSKIGRILITPNPKVEFYSCDFLQIEISKHHTKLLKLTNIKSEALHELERLITHNITFINERLIPKEIFIATASLLKTIDPKDTPFVALNTLLEGTLWTGDLKLYNGLIAKGYKNVVTTADLSLLLYNLDNG